jgi:hypothetical protein
MVQGATHLEYITAIAALIAAVGTVAAVIVALTQTWMEREARKRQERRAQAERISAWPADLDDDEGETPIALLNRSEEPVYRAVAFLILIQGAGASTGKELVDRAHHQWQAALSVIPAGEYHTVVAGGWRRMGARPGVELAFTDRAGVHWLRAADGALREIAKPPVEYYGLDHPVGWTIPTT